MGQTKKAKSQVFGVIALLLAVLSVVLSLFGVFNTPINVNAGYVKEFNFQGRLTNPDGTNVTDGAYNMTFRIYDVASGGAPLWSENHVGGKKVTVEDGVFNVNLGSINAINLNFNSGVYYLGIEVDGDGEMTPRRRIGGAGYSLNTERVYGTPGSINDTELSNSFPNKGIIDALNYLVDNAIPTAGVWTDTGTALRPRVGASQNVSIPSGTLAVSGAVGFSSTLNVSGPITGPTDETINGIDINAGVISDATWNGNAISDNYVAALSGAVQGDILYHNGVQWAQLAAGASGRFLMTQGAGADPLWNAVTGSVGDGTVPYSTLNWDGAAWAENTGVRTVGSSMSIGTGAAPVSGRSISLANSTNDGYGVHTAMSGGGTNIYGNYISLTGTPTNNFGASIRVTGAAPTNYGVYSEASGGATNYGGYFSGTTYGVYIASGATSDELYVDGTASFTGKVNAENGIDITNAALTLGSQNITGVGTDIAAAAGLTIGSTGAGSDIVLNSAGKIYFQDALITTPVPFALSGNTAAFEAAFAAADRGVIDALISLATGGSGLWLDAGTYLRPNSTYANDVAVDSGVMSIGTTPTAGYSLSIANSAANGRGVGIAMTGTTGTIYGNYISVTGAAPTNYGVYASASGGMTNWAGYFNEGNVYIKNFLGIDDSNPTSALSVGNFGRFRVDSGGDIIRINNVAYSWPTAQATASGYVLSNDATGNLSWVSLGSIGLRWDEITAPSGDQVLDMSTYRTTFNWATTGGNAFTMTGNFLTSGTLLNLTVDSTTAAGRTQRVLNISTAGANGMAGQKTFGLYASNTHTGENSENVAGYLGVSGATSNIGLQIVAATGGDPDTKNNYGVMINVDGGVNGIGSSAKIVGADENYGFSAFVSPADDGIGYGGYFRLGDDAGTPANLYGVYSSAEGAASVNEVFHGVATLANMAEKDTYGAYLSTKVGMSYYDQSGFYSTISGYNFSGEASKTIAIYGNNMTAAPESLGVLGVADSSSGFKAVGVRGSARGATSNFGGDFEVIDNDAFLTVGVSGFAQGGPGDSYGGMFGSHSGTRNYGISSVAEGGSLINEAFHGAATLSGASGVYGAYLETNANNLRGDYHQTGFYSLIQGSNIGAGKSPYIYAIQGVSANMGDHHQGLSYGVYGAATGASYVNYGIYGTASGGLTNWAGYFAGNVGLGGTTPASELRFYEPSLGGTNYTAFKARTQVADITYTLPAAVAGGSGYVLTGDATGVLSWTAPAVTVPLSSITAATAGNLIDSANYAQTWAWNSLTNQTALAISSNSTAGTASGTSTLLSLSRSGANANNSHTAYGLYSSVTNTGTTSTNIAGYFTASGASTNWAGYFVGNVGLGGTGSGSGEEEEEGPASELRFYEPSIGGTNYTAFKARTQVADITYTLPAAVAGGSGYVLTGDATGVLSWTAPGGLGVRWNEIVAPNGNLALDMSTYRTTFNWDTTTGNAFTMTGNSLTAGTLLNLTSATTGNQSTRVLNISTSGGNNTGYTTYGIYVSNTHTGLLSTNVAGYFSASGASYQNWAGYFKAGDVYIADSLSIKRDSVSVNQRPFYKLDFYDRTSNHQYGAYFDFQSTYDADDDQAAIYAVNSSTVGGVHKLITGIIGASTGASSASFNVGTYGLARNNPFQNIGVWGRTSNASGEGYGGYFEVLADVTGDQYGVSSLIETANDGKKNWGVNSTVRITGDELYTKWETDSVLSVSGIAEVFHSANYNSTRPEIKGGNFGIAVAEGVALQKMNKGGVTALEGNFYNNGIVFNNSEVIGSYGVISGSPSGTYDGATTKVVGVRGAIHASDWSGPPPIYLGVIAIGVESKTENINVNGTAGTNYGFYGQVANAYTNYGIYLNVAGGGGNDYGVYSTISGSAGNDYAGYFTNTGAATTNYGIYATASGASTNWAGYFHAGNVYMGGNLGIGDASPVSALTVGSGDRFQVNSSGNIVKINNVTYSWPAAQGAANTFLQNNGSGTLSWASTMAATSVPLSGITNATATNSINSANYAQTWAWNSLTNQTALTISSNSTAGPASGTSTLLRLTRSGANANASHTARGLYSSVTNTGTTATNIAGYFTASGATTNWAGYFGSGNVYITNSLGIGAGPSYPLHVSGDAYITGGLGVGVAQTTAGYIQADARIGVAMAPSYALDVTGQGRFSSYIAVNGVNPDSSYGVYSTTTSNNSRAIYGYGNGNERAVIYGVYGEAVGNNNLSDLGTRYGVYGTGSGTKTNSYGLYGTATGTGGTNYGVYATASGGTTNWAGYFVGNVGLGGTGSGSGEEEEEGPASELRFYEPSIGGTNYTAFKARTQVADITYTLPAAVAGGSGYVLTGDATGVLSWTAPAVTVPLSSITAATAGNLIDSGDYAQTWGWNTLSFKSALTISSTSTVGTADETSTLLSLTRSGANANTFHTAYGLSSSVTNTGEKSINYAGKFEASGAAMENTGISVIASGAALTNAGIFATASDAEKTNYGIYASASGGLINWAGYFGDGNVYIANSVGLNTESPGSRLDILDTSNPQLRLTYVDGVSYTTFQTNSDGDLVINPSAGNVIFGTSGPSHPVALIPAENDTIGYSIGTSAARWKTGYFVDGIVTGASSTTYAESSITRTTGGGLNVVLGGAAGDDFTVNTDTLVVVSDYDYVGINKATPGYALDVADATASGRGINVAQTGTGTTYGIYSSASGATTDYGGYFTASGTGTNYGIYATASGSAGDDNIAGYFTASNGNGKYVAYIVNTKDDKSADALAIKLSYTGSPLGPTNAFIQFLDASDNHLGAIVGDGRGGVQYATSGEDYAEYYPSASDWPAGTVVKLGQNGKLEQAIFGDEPLGVISSHPGFSGGRDIPGNRPLAMMGQVPTRVTNEGGTIRPGDKVTVSSRAGFAKKVQAESDPILGVAVESFDGSEGQVKVFVSMLSGLLSATASADGRLINGGLIDGDLGISGELDVAGTIKASSLWSQNATWHIDSLGEAVFQKVTAGDIEIIEGENKAIGRVTLPGLQKEIFVPNNSVTEVSRIFLTIESANDTSAGVKIKEKRPGQGFVISTLDGQVAPVDLSVNWLIIN